MDEKFTKHLKIKKEVADGTLGNDDEYEDSEPSETVRRLNRGE